MTIEKAHEILSNGLVNAPSEHEWCVAFKTALDTMRDYQELQRSLDEIRAEIIKYEGDCRLSVDEYPSCKQCTDNVFESIYAIIDKWKTESEK